MRHPMSAGLPPLAAQLRAAAACAPDPATPGQARRRAMPLRSAAIERIGALLAEYGALATAQLQGMLPELRPTTVRKALHVMWERSEIVRSRVVNPGHGARDVWRLTHTGRRP